MLVASQCSESIISRSVVAPDQNGWPEGALVKPRCCMLQQEPLLCAGAAGGGHTCCRSSFSVVPRHHQSAPPTGTCARPAPWDLWADAQCQPRLGMLHPAGAHGDTAPRSPAGTEEGPPMRSSGGTVAHALCLIGAHVPNCKT